MYQYHTRMWRNWNEDNFKWLMGGGGPGRRRVLSVDHLSVYIPLWNASPELNGMLAHALE